MAGKYEYSLASMNSNRKNFACGNHLLANLLVRNLILNFFACGACTQAEDGTFKAFSIWSRCFYGHH
ncbi:hypothetical protein DOY81_013669, partial [Sarcophaga bullata]